MIPVFVCPKQTACSLQITNLLPQMFHIPVMALHSC